METNNHQRDFIANLTVTIPYNGRNIPLQDSIVRLVSLEIGGSGFRLDYVDINLNLMKNKI